MIPFTLSMSELAIIRHSIELVLALSEHSPIEKTPNQVSTSWKTS